ncbi:hypothetical protein WME99_29775 [Sorangium sp. So ce136]|uniref:hypothetical protein n=1 Tax=Sorangium sp. So ce136 TaxID=3133284 RepID=UPI003F008E66
MAWSDSGADGVRRRARLFAALLGLLAVGRARAAGAQEGVASRARGACIRLAVIDSTPAVAEWSWWLAGGGGATFGGASEGGLGVLGVGSEMTTGFATFGSGAMYGGPVELRWGPWFGAFTDLEGARGEGGLLLSVGQVRHARWGTYALRLGGGLGDDRLGLASHLAMTLTGGVRSVAGRTSERGACDPPSAPGPSAFATGLRFFGTARAGLGDEPAWQLTFGIELEPTFLLPPHSFSKWIGAHR